MCNYDCWGCNRFNNYVFKGHQLWKDYQHIYQAWADRMDIKKMVLIGGEPMANPSFLEWVNGLKSLWPDGELQISTNGSMIDPRDRRLYNLLIQRPDTSQVYISLHNKNMMDSTIDRLRQWLVGPVIMEESFEDFGDIDHDKISFQKSYNGIKDESWPPCDGIRDFYLLPDAIQKECRDMGLIPEYFSDNDLVRESRFGYILRDSNGLLVKIFNEDYFSQSAVIEDHAAQRFRLHDSDPIKAHEFCSLKTCHTFIQGGLYKCAVSAVLPQLNQQYDIEISDQDRTILYGYQPATLDMTDDEIQKFIKNLGNHIDQCKFCPEHYQWKKIESQVKKVRFYQKSRLTDNPQKCYNTDTNISG